METDVEFFRAAAGSAFASSSETMSSDNIGSADAVR